MLVAWLACPSLAMSPGHSEVSNGHFQSYIGPALRLFHALTKRTNPSLLSLLRHNGLPCLVVAALGSCTDFQEGIWQQQARGWSLPLLSVSLGHHHRCGADCCQWAACGCRLFRRVKAVLFRCHLCGEPLHFSCHCKHAGAAAEGSGDEAGPEGSWSEERQDAAQGAPAGA